MTMQDSTHVPAPGALVRDRVVAGFDGSSNSVLAVEWAAREAQARAAELRVVTCWAVPPQVDFYGVGARQVESLGSLVASLRDRHPNLLVEPSATHLDPRDALIDEATHADLLVVGASESGTAKAALLGSVARTAARRSPCPVVVVRGDWSRPIRRVVVGTDASSAAGAALDWAADAAVRHGAELVVLHAEERDVSRAEAQCIVDLAVNECAERIGCRVRGVLVDGSPSSALIEASRDADLVVIGSRGRSGFKTMLFGSVALSVAESAYCPVAVTHPQVPKR